MHWDFSVINWSKRNSINIFQKRWLTTSWGIYTHQPYDPFRKRVCVNAGACSHAVYLPHGYWKMVVLLNVSGKKFLGTERGHYKLFWRMVTGPTLFSFPILSWYRFPKACSGILIFLFLFLLFIRCSCSIYIFLAVVLTICKKTKTELN